MSRGLTPIIVSFVRTNRSCCLTALLVLFSVPAAAADAVTAWNARAGQAAVAACLAPEGNALQESRMYAMVHAAIHDAVNAIDRRSQPYAYDVLASPTASVDAAVAAAARDVLVAVIAQLPELPHCLVNGTLVVETEYAAALAAIPGGAAKTDGLAVGQAAAAAILALRAADGSNQPLVDSSYPQGDSPGEYRFTPGLPLVFAPAWGKVTPFALIRSSQFRPGAPYTVTTAKYTADFNEVKSLGGNNAPTVSARTPLQTETGLFWVESSPLAWNRIARQVAETRGLALWENARLFGLLNLAMADGYIASWDTKFHYNFWRPVTAIQLAADDGNPDTVGDPTWTPLILTYPMPDYDSAHSVEGGAAAQVLADFFGTDAIPFTACSFTLPPGSRCGEPGVVVRPYATFSAAAAENGESRILVGIHFRDAVEAGIRHGRQIGQFAVRQHLRPLQ
jgi:hypothetical protein